MLDILNLKIQNLTLERNVLLLEWGAPLGYDEEKKLKKLLEKAGFAVSPSRLRCFGQIFEKKFPREKILSEAERHENFSLEG
ncbi:MAG: hypothetical protein Ct9H300mP28_34220 [Pseudomonadota bacterium]|nr:MAG: hypothetical protein Ct9H300mP28_34220 [Pseudomonadota bacterium]